MADEITYSQQTRISKQLDDDPLIRIAPSFETYIDVFDWAGSKRFSSEATISTTYGAVSVGAITTAGWVRFHNLDSTNFVEFGIEIPGPTFSAFIKVGPGIRTGWIPLSSMTFYGRANTGNCQVVVEAIEGAITKA